MALSPQLVGSFQIVAGLVALVLLKPAVDNPDTPGSRGYAVFTVGVALWMFGLALPKFTVDYTLTVGSFHVLIAGTELAVAGWLLLALSVTDRTHLVRRTAIVLGGGIFLLQSLLWTNPLHQALYTPGPGVTEGWVVRDVDTAVVTTFGWWWVHTAASYLCGLTGEVLLVGGAIGSTGIRRRQLAWLSLVAVPIIPASVVSSFGLFDLAYNVSAVGFLLAVPILAVVLFRARLLDIVPVARRTATDRMEAAMITLDGEARVVDANERARELFDCGPNYVGTPAAEFFESVSEDVYSRSSDEDDDETEVTIGTDGQQRHFLASSSPIGDHHEGRIVLLYDITPQKRRERELEETKQSLAQSNERLDQFASVVSHDLRSPLSVATGRLEFARKEADSEHLVAVADAHERMEALIDDLLSLARHGDTIEETDAVGLATLAETTWQHVPTAEATLVVETEQTVCADSSRLRELLENLFRNAVEHAGEDVTVTVGALGDGFYVADDGPGIPAEDRGDVFDAGYSTAAEGTGFGLNIVREIARAHGWEIAVSESEQGGTRFELTGVEITE